MTLCINIGNTNIHCAFGVKDNYKTAFISIKNINKPEDFLDFIKENFTTSLWHSLDKSIISSVVPDKTFIVCKAIEIKTGKTPSLFDISKLQIDLSKYKSRLGEDRGICSNIAFLQYKSPVIVFDLGTATTVNVVDVNGVFVGGAILVGVQTGLMALAKNTALLPQIDEFSNVTIIGDDTKKNLISGAIIGTVSILEGYINRINNIVNAKSKVVITGGNAPFILPYCTFDFVYRPTLLLDGLFILSES